MGKEKGSLTLSRRATAKFTKSYVSLLRRLEGNVGGIWILDQAAPPSRGWRVPWEAKISAWARRRCGGALVCEGMLLDRTMGGKCSVKDWQDTVSSLKFALLGQRRYRAR